MSNNVAEIELEEIALINCNGIYGLYYGEPVFLRESNIYITEDGLSYKGGSKAGNVIDCKGRTVVQSFFDGHSHLPYAAFRYVSGDVFHSNPLETTEFESKISAELIKTAAEAMLIDYILSGVTGLLNMYYFPQEIAKLSNAFGIKIITGPLMLGSIANGDIERSLKSFLNAVGDARNVKLSLNLRYIFDLDEHALELLTKYLSENSDLILNLHVSQKKEEVFYSMNKYKVTPVIYLKRKKLLSSSTVLSGLNWVTSSEVEHIVAENSWVVHSPVSAMLQGIGGFFPYIDFVKKGYNRVLLGTDGGAFGSSLDMIHVASTELLLQHYGSMSMDISSDTVIKAIWKGWELFSPSKSCINEGCSPDLLVMGTDYPIIDNVSDLLLFNISKFKVSSVCIFEKGCIVEEELQDLKDRMINLYLNLAKKS